MEMLPNSQKNNQPKKENTIRNTFLSMVAGAVALVSNGEVVASPNSGDKIIENKYFKQEQEVNDLAKHFEGKESSYVYVVEAATKLIYEMESNKIKEVDLYTKANGRFVSEKIDILRTFIEKHLQSENGHHYAVTNNDIRGKIFSEKNFDVESLLKIINKAKHLNDWEHERSSHKKDHQ